MGFESLFVSATEGVGFEEGALNKLMKSHVETYLTSNLKIFTEESCT